MMFSKIRMAAVAAGSSLAMLAAVAPSAHAGLLSLATGPCGQQESQPFAGDSNYYVGVPGGTFEPGSQSWLLNRGAQVVTGGAYDGSRSLSLPAGSSATSPAVCTGIDHPSMRFFVRNTGSSTGRLRVYGTYPLLGGLLYYTANLGTVSGTGTWEPSSVVQIGLLNNTLGSLTLAKSMISFTFVPSGGSWQVDDVYLDPFHRY